MAEKLDSITRRLADVQRRLLDLPSDAFAERYELQRQQDALREEAAAFHDELDASRSDADLISELRGLRDQLRSIANSQINTASQVGGNPSGGAGDGGKGAIVINAAMRQAQGIDRVKARIAQITQILERRGVEIR